MRVREEDQVTEEKKVMGYLSLIVPIARSSVLVFPLFLQHFCYRSLMARLFCILFKYAFGGYFKKLNRRYIHPSPIVANFTVPDILDVILAIDPISFLLGLFQTLVLFQQKKFKFWKSNYENASLKQKNTSLVNFV